MLTEYETYALGYAYRLMEDRLSYEEEIRAMRRAQAARYPIRGVLLAAQELFKENRETVQTLRLMQNIRRRIIGQYGRRNVALDACMQWIWLEGYCFDGDRKYKDFAVGLLTG